MEPYRAFIADKLDPSQQATGFQAQSFFTGFGQTLANVSLFVFPMIFVGTTGKLPTWVYASFFLGSICSIASIWWSSRTTAEIPPTDAELQQMRATPLKIFTPFLEIAHAIKDMPRVMWQLALVYLFQWYALFCYWQNSSKSIALSVYKTTPQDNPKLYEEAVSWTGLVNGWYNIVTFLSAFALVWFAKRYSPGIGFIVFPMIENKYLLFPAITGFGIGWASMMGIPYLMVVSEIPKERYGVYMGIINMMIVIPMIIQNLTFGYILKHFLHNDSGKAILLAGVCLLVAAAATMLITNDRYNYK
jgi:maltose/moltooligosaccharide transporter